MNEIMDYVKKKLKEFNFLVDEIIAEMKKGNIKKGFIAGMITKADLRELYLKLKILEHSLDELQTLIFLTGVACGKYFAILKLCGLDET
ncbi:MAG: hypothetical protein ACTSVW_00425 [Candidatus Njordarchaeales archaeon]